MKHRTSVAAVFAAVVFSNLSVAQADPGLHARVRGATTIEGGYAARSTASAHGEHGAAAGRRGIVADGQGNVKGAASGAFTTQSGVQGARNARINRSSDGSATASGQASVSGASGSADRSGSYTRNADGTASGERGTTVTNANTGVTFDAATTYNKGSGVSRSASCKDAAGNSVTCFSR
jgi:hypothetical protein